MVHGRHVMKWGGEYRCQRSPNYGLFEENGEVNYTDFNSFLANTPILTQVAYGQPVLRFKENDVALYFQDDWRIKDNLTLNLGLRWEVPTSRPAIYCTMKAWRNKPGPIIFGARVCPLV